MIKKYYKAITVYRRVDTKDQFGYIKKGVETPIVLDESLGLVNGGTQAQGLIADKYQVTQQFNFYTSVSNDIKQNDVVEFEGERYLVVTNPKNTVKRNHHYKYIVVRSDSGV